MKTKSIILSLGIASLTNQQIILAKPKGTYYQRTCLKNISESFYKDGCPNTTVAIKDYDNNTICLKLMRCNLKDSKHSDNYNLNTPFFIDPIFSQGHFKLYKQIKNCELPSNCKVYSSATSEFEERCKHFKYGTLFVDQMSNRYREIAETLNNDLKKIFSSNHLKLMNFKDFEIRLTLTNTLTPEFCKEMKRQILYDKPFKEVKEYLKLAQYQLLIMSKISFAEERAFNRILEELKEKFSLKSIKQSNPELINVLNEIRSDIHIKFKRGKIITNNTIPTNLKVELEKESKKINKLFKAEIKKFKAKYIKIQSQTSELMQDLYKNKKVSDIVLRNTTEIYK